MPVMFESTRATGADTNIDPNASPVDSVDSSTTPSTEISPPDSPYQKQSIPKNEKLWAKRKLAQLTQAEKVCTYS